MGHFKNMYKEKLVLSEEWNDMSVEKNLADAD